jgi:hypothetical protein
MGKRDKRRKECWQKKVFVRVDCDVAKILGRVLPFIVLIVMSDPRRLQQIRFETAALSGAAIDAVVASGDLGTKWAPARGRGSSD